MPLRRRFPPALCASTALAVGLTLVSGGAALADGGPAPAEPTADNVRDFFDERVPALLEEYDVPGAVVSAVADGEEVFAGGYGLADVGAERPVDVENDAFPIASVSKSFTAVAALQLVERGELDLHTDVNEYLPEELRIADTHPGRPVTLHHLLTHTAGFEEVVTAMLVENRDEVLGLADYVVEYEPDRVYVPGEFTAYSNYGTALVGLLVQEVSGTPFRDYLDENVFGVLGMERSGLRHPDEAAETMGAPTPYGDSPDVLAPVLYLNPTPAGGVYATASDMSRFMLALLNGGEVDGRRVLSAQSTAELTTQQASSHPSLTGSGYGTWERYFDGPRVLGHGGDLDGAHSRYAVLPEHGLGVFVSVNGDGNSDGNGVLDDARNLIVEEFLAVFAPSGSDGEAEFTAAELSGEELERYAGFYTTTRSGRGDPNALFSAFDTVTVEAGADGLHTTSALLGESDWTPAEPGVFRSEAGDRMAFIERDGEIVGADMGLLPWHNYERMPWYGNLSLHLVTVVAALATMVTVVAWPVVALVRRLRGRSRSASAAARAARWTAATAAAVCLGYAVAGAAVAGDPNLLGSMVSENSPLLTVPLTVAAVAAAGALVGAVGAWANRWWGTAGQIHYTLVALAAAAFAAVGTRYGLTLLPVPVA